MQDYPEGILFVEDELLDEEDYAPWLQAEAIPLPSRFIVARCGSFGVQAVFSGLGRCGGNRIQNDIEGWNVWIGIGVLPDLTSPPTTFSATLPISTVITPPGAGTLTHYVLITKQDVYGLNSQNQQYTTITIDSSGNLILPPIVIPQGLMLVLQADGFIRVFASYPSLVIDQYPATYWKVWVKSTPPNVGVDTPAAVVLIDGYRLYKTIGSLSPGTYYVAVALYRTTDAALSDVLRGTIVVPGDPEEVVAVPSGYQLE